MWAESSGTAHLNLGCFSYHHPSSYAVIVATNASVPGTTVSISAAKLLLLLLLLLSNLS